MSDRLRGKHYWLVGASSGIGRALALELAKRGVHLTLSARSLEKLQSLQKEIGDKATIKQLDVTDADAIDGVVSELEDLSGVVFLAAAYNAESGNSRTDAKRIFETVNINLIGGIYLAEAVKAKLQSAPDGVLALYGSIAGYSGLPNGQPYSATKAGLINYAESLRTELRGSVDVKIINSGFVDTRLTRKNDFRMPMLITPEVAARRIADGLESRRFEIVFPRRFAWVAKLLRGLPYWLFFRATRRL